MSADTLKIAINLADIDIKPLDQTIGRAAFSCGVKRIDNFLKNNCRDHHETGRVRVYYALHNDNGTPRLVGFYTLVVSSEAAINISEEADKKFERVKVAPLVYLAMVGVDESAKSYGIGKMLMLHAMKTTLLIADLAGVYALSLDARDEIVAKFYEALGFAYFTTGALRMYLPVREIRAALQGK